MVLLLCEIVVYEQVCLVGKKAYFETKTGKNILCPRSVTTIYVTGCPSEVSNAAFPTFHLAAKHRLVISVFGSLFTCLAFEASLVILCPNVRETSMARTDFQHFFLLTLYKRLHLRQKTLNNAGKYKNAITDLNL